MDCQYLYALFDKHFGIFKLFFMLIAVQDVFDIFIQMLMVI